MPPQVALVLLPAAAAVLYALAAVVLKRASQLGVDVWQTAFAVNLSGAACYSLLWPIGGAPVHVELWWQPALVTLCLFAGMLTQLVALNRGDVSVAVPVMGIKILIVAYLTPLLVGETVRPILWWSAALSVVGVAFLNWRGHGSGRRSSVTTAMVGGCATAGFFGVFDLLVQKWGPSWGPGRLLPCVYWANAVLSLACVFGFRKPLRSLPRPALKWLLAGALLVSAQSILFVGCLAVYGGATSANITFSLRGLISIGLIWTLGHRLDNVERLLGPRVLFRRLLGAAIMLLAILLAVIPS